MPTTLNAAIAAIHQREMLKLRKSEEKIWKRVRGPGVAAYAKDADVELSHFNLNFKLYDRRNGTMYARRALPPYRADVPGGVTFTVTNRRHVTT